MSSVGRLPLLLLLRVGLWVYVSYYVSVACSRGTGLLYTFIAQLHRTHAQPQNANSHEHRRSSHIIQADPEIPKTRLFVVTLSQSRPRSDQPIAQLRLLRPTDVAFSARSVRPLTTLDMPTFLFFFFFLENFRGLTIINLRVIPLACKFSQYYTLSCMQYKLTATIL